MICMCDVLYCVKTGEPPAKKSKFNPKVFMEISIGNQPAGKIVILVRIIN